jgi:hypothetical protein
MIGSADVRLKPDTTITHNHTDTKDRNVVSIVFFTMII